MADLTQAKLKELLHYNPDTGIFTWLNGRGNGTLKEDKAGSICNNYIEIGVNKISYYAHRLAWLYMEGYFPENEIDHINRIKDDNRWCNLRHVSSTCNKRNRDKQSNNTSGVSGVTFHKHNNLWQAQIKVNNKNIYIGAFKDFIEAVAHRLVVEQCFNWKGCDNSSTAYQYMEKYLNGRLK